MIAFRRPAVLFLSLMMALPPLPASADARGEAWEYDPGPDVSTEAGYGYAKLFAETPNYRELGRVALGGGRSEKFRWKFGPMFYRGRTGENQVKVLIIGQEGAQDENISDRSFTGGTGGRMQNMLHALGVESSYLFINTFAYTIKGQYADYAPVLTRGKLRWTSLITDEMFRLAQEPESPVVKHRHELIDHVIRSNKDSLKLIIAVGGAAQDSLATYIESKGGECPTYVRDASDVQLVEYRSVNAGGNRSFFYPVDSRGRNLLLREGESQRDFDFADVNVQRELMNRGNDPAVLEKLVKRTGGPYANGVSNLRQLGTRLDGCKARGKTGTLKGLEGISQDVRYIEVMHPGSNSPRLLREFKNALAKIASWQGDGGWRLPADPGMVQPFDQGFRYSHKPVPRRDFRFGLPDVIGRGTTNSTRRGGGRAIEFGSRDRGSYPRVRDAYTPGRDFTATDVAWEPNKTDFTEFDPGPGEYWAKVFTGADGEVPSITPGIFRLNPTADAKFGADAIYRGRPDSSEVLVLADQHSHDDMWVGRALMGLEGQKLQAFLDGIGAGTNYTILRTLPVDTLGAPQSTIDKLLEYTSEWRSAIWTKLLRNDRNAQKVKLILTLGSQADRVIEELETDGVPVVSLTASYEDAFSKVRRVHSWRKRGMKLQTEPMPIARMDIPYGMRRWVGTSGDRVARSGGRFDGKLYQIHAPDWATRQRPPRLTSEEARRLGNLGLL